MTKISNSKRGLVFNPAINKKADRALEMIYLHFLSPLQVVQSQVVPQEHLVPQGQVVGVVSQEQEGIVK